MVDLNTAPAPLGEDTGDEGASAGAKKQWTAPRLARLDGRRAMTGAGGTKSDHTNATSAILS
jgi:hypothetical protein